MRRGLAYALIGAAAALPRLAALLYERGDILAGFTEKSDDFARTFVGSGTFGFVPPQPSAYTQPLYGFFLVPIYWILGRSWPAVGLAQIAIAIAIAWLVYEIGRRWISPRAGVAAALLATLNPYLVWHDVHVNREILDQLLAAAIVLLGLATAERRSLALGAPLGAVSGLAILGNVRLAALPLLLIGYLAWRFGLGRRLAAVALVLLVACTVVVLPWMTRNRVVLGCFALTTDARALWKANNAQTYAILAGGGWIDDVPRPPNVPYNPEEAADVYRNEGRVVPVDECAQMRYYRGLVLDFWREHPGEKARLAGQAVGMLWNPRPTRTEGRSGAGTGLDLARSWIAPAYVSGLYVLGLVGLAVLPRRLTALGVALLGYQTAAAMVFAGTTRYRAPWDFVIALLAAGGLLYLARRFQAGAHGRLLSQRSP